MKIFSTLIFCVGLFFFLHGVASSGDPEYEKYCVDPEVPNFKRCVEDCESRSRSSRSFDYQACHMECLNRHAEKMLECDRNLKNKKSGEQPSAKNTGRERCLYLVKNSSQSEALNSEYYNAINCCSYIIKLEWDCAGGKRMHDPKSFTIEPNMRGRYDMNCTPGSKLTGKATKADKMDSETRYGYPTSFCEQKKPSDAADIVKQVEVNK